MHTIKRIGKRIYDAGGCDATDDYGQGYDDSITLALNILLEETEYTIEEILDYEEDDRTYETRKEKTTERKTEEGSWNKMDVRNGCVGLCEVDSSGETIRLEREFFQQGWIFKDWRAFRNNMDAPCYVPELDDTVYTKKDFLQSCNNQEEIAEELFEQLDWHSPSTLFNEWEDMGEIETCEDCGKLLMAFSLEKCPYCGRDIKGE